MNLPSPAYHTLEGVVEMMDKTEGLTSREAAEKLRLFGPNRLAGKKKVHPAKIFLSQFKDFLTLVLLGGTVVSVLTGEYAEALTIAVIVLLNGLLGFLQEFKTERTLEALKKMAAPKARAWRDGELVLIDAAMLVPGDVVELEAGDKIPADGAVLLSAGLSCDESMLTGESVAVPKAACREENPELRPDRADFVYMGTTAVSGRGKARILATGMESQMGKIAGMLQEIPDEPTPLQKRLDSLGKYIAAGCLIVCAVVAAAGLLRGEPLRDMLMTGISLAVAAVPEGLAAVVTISLALAVRRMVKRNALLRKLAAVETLGCADVICTDKTGTLTENRMTVSRLWLPSEEKGMGEAGKLALTAFSLCSDVLETHDGRYTGDPTETALCEAARQAGLPLKTLQEREPRLGEVPFDSARKRMSVLVSVPGGRRVYCKGGCDILLSRCTSVYDPRGSKPMDASAREKIAAEADKMAAEGLRVLAAAYRPLGAGEAFSEKSEEGLIFLGLAGMIDPPRPEVKEAVRLCKRAGIRTVMITGDHKLTAKAIAKEVGIWKEGDGVLTGEELDKLDEKRQRDAVAHTTVFARVSPRHKLMIVRALKASGHIAAMTGDGVNDAPAIREADIGVSMGQGGADVTREASDLVLLDDNFATLVAAVEEGRAIYKNIRGFIRYLLACNIGEVLTMFLGMLMGMPVVLNPIHILVVNLVTDGLPAIALGLEPAAKGLMDRPPRRADEGVFSDGLLGKILFRGCLIGLTTLFVFSHFLALGDLTAARTAAFFTLVFCQLLHVFECRSEEKPLWKLNPFGNVKLIGAVCVSAAISVAAVYLPALHPVLDTAAIPLPELPFIILSILFAPVLSGLLDAFFRPGKGENTHMQINKTRVWPKKPRKSPIFVKKGVDTSGKIR